MEYLIVVVALLIGIVIGIFIGIFIGMERMRKAIEESSVGHLRIDQSEPDEPPKPFLEIRKGITLDDIAQKNIVMLKVINENYVSQN